MPQRARWFVTKDGRTRLGPYTAEQLRELALDGRLVPDDMILLEGRTKWIPARDIKSLFGKRRSRPQTPQRRGLLWPIVGAIVLVVVAFTAGYLVRSPWGTRPLELVEDRPTRNAPNPQPVAHVPALVPQPGPAPENPAPEPVSTPVSVPMSVHPQPERLTTPPVLVVVPERISESPTPTSTVEAPPYSAIDKHALAASDDDEASLATLAKYLGGPCKTDAEKARAVYRWITDRIAYDLEGLRDRKNLQLLPADVLRSRKAVCAGYSALYADLAKRLGLEAVVILGHLKGYGYVAGQPLDQRTSHAWNAVKIDSRWRLVDATAGAGGINDGKFVKQFNGGYFFSPPDQFVFLHFPDDQKWQLLEKPWTKEQFLARPVAAAGYFTVGVSPDDVLAAASDKSFAGLPELCLAAHRSVRSAKMPLNKRLRSGDEVTIELSSDDYVRMVAVNAGTYAWFTRDGNKFVVTVRVEKGELLIGGKKTETDQEAEGLLRYTVE
jgi:transglutaminase-like putative cysteine protease